MTFKELARIITEKEGKAKEMNIAQIQEVLSILSDLMYLDTEVSMCLLNNGKKRWKKGRRLK